MKQCKTAGHRVSTQARPATQRTTTPDPVTARFWNGDTFDERKFLSETIPLQGGNNGEDLYRDLNQHLFIKSYEWDEQGTKVIRCHLRVVSYAEACDWLVRMGQQRPPEKFLALHGIGPESASAKLPPAAGSEEWIKASLELPRETLDRLNLLAQATRTNPARVAGAAVRKCLRASIFDEILLAYEHAQVTALPGLPEEILGPALHSKVQHLALRAGMLVSELVLAVLWKQVCSSDDVRQVIRSEGWFLPAARQIVKLAGQSPRQAERAQNQPDEFHKQGQKGGTR
jgi:hypothetical protein